MSGWYLPRYNWSVAKFHGTPNWCLRARLPGDRVATEPGIVQAVEQWATSTKRRYDKS